jgi:hypothetical protein
MIIYNLLFLFDINFLQNFPDGVILRALPTPQPGTI